MTQFIRNQFSKIIAFGNSYSDNGEANRISKDVMKRLPTKKDIYMKPGGALYWNNRYSDGYTSVEVLAQMLNIDVINFATGGATSGRKNYTDWMDAFEETGVLAQVDKYENSLERGMTDEDALYFIFPFENDYFKYVDFNESTSLEHLCDTALQNVVLAVRHLISIKAKKFFIVGCSNLALVPYEQMMQRTVYAGKFRDYINNNLPDVLQPFKELNNVQIVIFDHVKASEDILKSSENGICNYKEACQVTYPEVLHVRECPEQFYFWDEWHFSKAAHKLFGKDMYKKIALFDWKS